METYEKIRKLEKKTNELSAENQRIYKNIKTQW